MKNWQLSLLLILVLSISFLASSNFPNGLFTLKELGFYFVVSATSLMVALTLLFIKKHKINTKFTRIDSLAFILLVFIPLFQLFIMKISWPSFGISVGTFILYYSANILSRKTHWTLVIRDLRLVLIVILTIQILISGLQFAGLMNAYHSTSKISGMFFNPSPFSIFLSSLFVLSLPFVLIAVMKQSAINKAISIIYILTLLLILTELDSRSSWIALSFGTFVVIYYYLVQYKTSLLRTYRKLIRLSFVSLLLITPYILFWLYSIRPESATGRILVWKSSISMLIDNFFTGVGIDNFSEHYPLYQARELENKISNERYGILSGEINYAFNDVLQCFLETGVVGGLIYLWIISLSLYNINSFFKKRGFSNYRFMTSAGLSGGILVIFIAGMTAYPNQMLPIKIWFWILIALANSITASRIENSRKSTCIRGVFLFSIIGLCFLFFGFKKLSGYLLWQKNQLIAVDVTEMVSFAAYMGNDGFYLRDIGRKYSQVGQYHLATQYLEKSISRKFNKDNYYLLAKHYEKIGEYEKAFSQYKIVESAIPHLIKPKYLQAMLYYKLDKIKHFEVVANDLIKSEPKVYNPETVQMKREIKFLLSKIETQ